jgi:hypothetical protein
MTMTTRIWSLLLGLAACDTIKLPGQSDCEGPSGLDVTRMVEHGGGGRELTVRLRYPDGVPGGSDLAGCLSVQRGGSKLGAAVAKRKVDDAYTLLLVDPGATTAESEAARGLVRAVVKRLPAQDKVAVFRWAAAVTQAAPFTRDRALVEERIALGLVPSRDPRRAAAEALAEIAPAVAKIDGPARDALRTVVVISPRAPGLVAAAAKAAGPHLLAWLGPPGADLQLDGVPGGLRFVAADPDSAATALASRLEAYKTHAHYGLGLCAGAGAISGELAFGDLDELVAIQLPGVAEENRGGSCSAPALAQSRRIFPRQIELVLTDEERAGAMAAYADRMTKPKWPLSVRLAPGGHPVPAMASFRGESSYSCARRNYSVNLDGKAPRFLFPGFASSKFHLVAMCADRLYLRNFTALTLMAEEGLFPVPFEMVELLVDGVTQGPYMLVENVADSLRDHSSRVSAVIRRVYGPGNVGTKPEVRWTAGTDEEALASYGGIFAAAGALAGPALEAAMRVRLDLDGYMRWLAVVNAIGSGDYIDEVYLYGAQTTAGDGSPADLYMIAGWDQDDLFTACHASGRNALLDPFGLLECTESELDKRLFVDPHMYDRYSGVLAKLLDRLPQARFDRALAATAERLLRHFKDPKVLDAMVELKRLNPDAGMSFETARTMIESDVELLQVQFAARRAELQARLERYRKR